MEITRQIQYDLPDDYLSDETTLGLKADWTYTGPDKIWVFVDNETNKFISVESFNEYCDDVDYEKQLTAMTRRAGFNSYPVIIDFENDPLLISAIAQNAPEMKDMDVKNYYHHETGEWIYARPNPTVPDHTIELKDCEYDKERGEWKKPYPWKKPHTNRETFLSGYNMRLEIERKTDTSKFSENQKKKWDSYISELEGITVKFEKYLDTPWMILLPDSPIIDPDWQNL
jgi:hypothetical protein